MNLKIVLQILVVVLLLHGMYTAFFRTEKLIDKNRTQRDPKSVRKMRWTIALVNLFIWGSAFILIEVFM
jgi:hypothetical protein